MLVDVRHDREFQAFLGKAEQRLHARMVPILAQGMRLYMSRGSVPAMHYMQQRGEPVLVRHYKRIYRDVYNSLPEEVAKAAGVNGFIDTMLSWIEREGGRQIQNISQSLMDFVNDTVMAGVRNEWGNDRIARQLREDIPVFSRNRSATIARTETHKAANAAMRESLDYKHITIRTKTWWAVNDKRTRASHRAMHGVTVPMNEPFVTDDGEMMHPGDDSRGADAGGIINCRCTVLYNT